MLKAIAILEPSSTPAACMSRSSAEIWSSSTNTRRSPAWVKSTCAARNVAEVTRTRRFSASQASVEASSVPPTQ